MANIFGRQVVLPVTNKSGGALVLGDVVIVDTTNDTAVTTTTSAASTLPIGVVQESIANNATGRVLFGGYTSLVNTAASVTRGHYGTTHTVAKQATSTASRGAGTFCQFLTGGTTPAAFVFPSDLLGSSLTNPMTTAGDIIVGGASGAPARLAAGTSGYPLVGGGAGVASAYAISGGAHGCISYHSTTQSVNGTYIPMNTDQWDSDNFHFTSQAALTGTVTKSAASATITGSGTSFTTELTVNQVISIPGTAVEYGVVKTITNNTSLELWQTMANSASGQTATRRSDCFAIPAGFGGTYSFEYGSNVASLAAGEFMRVQLNNASGISTNMGGTAAVGSGYVSGSGRWRLVPGDFVSVLFSGNRTLGHASAFEAQSHFSMALDGT